ncbi:3500_t:CDS:2 [Racocetra fulgida]|uniref:3500_t:CDS:1 n=1 Tax=Racocetra fulgida TaxID=60492 RepID=A0A9N8WJR8_9GLOM|nr:3500_t:CDS:2 [Racocetra fulgida]
MGSLLTELQENFEKLDGPNVLIRPIKDNDSSKQKWIFEKEPNLPKILTPPIPKNYITNDFMSLSSESSYFSDETL